MHRGRDAAQIRVPTAAVLRARALTYRFRYCPSCRREWPADQQSCLQCRRWLGEQPSERIEWQIAPPPSAPSSPVHYECVAASALVLRIVSDRVADELLLELRASIAGLFAPARRSAIHRVAEQGWLLSTPDEPRLALREAIDLERHLAGALPKISAQLCGARLRWGIWTDQYVLQFDAGGVPAIGPATARAIFGFEPDDALLVSETVHVANRRHENFVAVPRRLLAGESSWGFHWLGHKRPSAIDHAAAPESSPFTARRTELAMLDRHRRDSAAATLRVAIIAEAGSGKTRLIREWLRRSPGIRFLSASFSLFGGDLLSFALQLVPLPADDPATEEILREVLANVSRKRVQVLVIDDIHFADAEGSAFLRRLMSRLPSRGVMALLASRPSGRALVESLAPTALIALKPLSPRAGRRLARQGIGSQSIAAEAARRSKGNPLFIEHFGAWAQETGYKGGPSGPRGLHEVISERIAYLSRVRIKAVRDTLSWGQIWQRRDMNDELDRLEAEIGLWLDRLETGDYGDRVQAARYLVELRGVDYDIFLASAIAGKPRPRSSRLREAIDRLTLGAAAQILSDLRERAKGADGAERANLLDEAERAGNCAYEAFQWPLAVEFYELALALSPPRETEGLETRIAECRRRTEPQVGEALLAGIAADDPGLEHQPAVDWRRLPDVWLQLGYRYARAEYWRQAAAAAEAINDRVLAEWARHKAPRCSGPR
ncbi:MAG: hypothetical protein EPO20_07910 [Betaproteobacteria bacterium]|nr:MAG: hypothetical protein EPO20_07910 [Betaproteobacteria bacterium]